MSALDLIYAAASEDSQATEQTFNDLMKSRISEIIQAKREQLAKSLFNTPEETQED
jgi:hypothetical protein